MAAISNDVKIIIQQFIKLVSQNGINIEKAILFGSYAKGTATSWSDIDLALVSNDFAGSSFYDRKKLNPFLIKIDSRLELHPFRSEDFNDENPLIKEIISQGIEIK